MGFLETKEVVGLSSWCLRVMIACSCTMDDTETLAQENNGRHTLLDSDKEGKLHFFIKKTIWLALLMKYDPLNPHKIIDLYDVFYTDILLCVPI